MSDTRNIVERLREALAECAEVAALPDGNLREGIERLRAQRDAHEEACECAFRAAPIILAHTDEQAAKLDRLRGLLAEALQWVPGKPGTVGARANDDLRQRIADALSGDSNDR